MMLALQTPITLFNILYLDATRCDRSKKPIIIGALLFTVVVGVLYGHWRRGNTNSFDPSTIHAMRFPLM